jgi:uncharacterized membrane protein YfcA
MSTMPPDGPTESSATPGPPTPPPAAPPPPPFGGETVVTGTASGGGGGGGGTQIAITDIARLPMPGNAEFALWAFLEIIFTLIWWFNDQVDASEWMTITAALTFGYFISRGVAKASRVLEQ